MSQMKTGAILSYLSIFVTILVALIYTPIMIRLLGQAEYGLFSLIGSIIAYFSILDLGLGNAIIRYTARNRAVGDKETEARLNGMFLILFAFIGVITILIGIIFYNTIDIIFNSNLTINELEKAKIMVIIITVNFSISFPLAIFGSFMQAYERFIIIKVISIIRTVAIPLITLPILFIGYGSIAMVLVSALVNISLLLYNMFYCFKNLNIKFQFGTIEPTLFKEILGYSFFVFLGIVVDQIYWRTDQFILGMVSGTVPVAIYAISMQFIQLYMKFSASISGLFLPKTSIMVANNATGKELTTHMTRYGRVQFLVMALICSTFILYGHDFIIYWAGTNYSDSYIIALIVMIPLTIPLIQNFGISVLYAKNMQKFRSVILILIAVINVFATIILVKRFGGIGAASATAITLSIGNIIIMNIYYHRKIGMDMIKFWKSITKMTIPIFVLILLGLIVKQHLPEEAIFLLIQILFYTFLYMITIWLFSMNKYEKELFLSILKNMKRLVVRRL